MQIIRPLTKEGFKKAQCPKEVWDLILKNFLNNIEEDEYVEGDGNLDYWIKSNKHRIATTKVAYNSDDIPTILNLLKPYLEDFSGVKLKDGILYHIRRYKNGANLKMHRDNAPTHHVGVNITINVDGNQWPFEIEDHSGNIHEVFINPGEMVFYEASRLLHGRPKNFEGNHFTNTFIHFKVDE